MVTKRFLKCALLALLAFTFFCLIILEVTLNDRRLASRFRHITGSNPNGELVLRPARNASSSSSSSGEAAKKHETISATTRPAANSNDSNSAVKTKAEAKTNSSDSAKTNNNTSPNASPKQSNDTHPASKEQQQTSPKTSSTQTPLVTGAGGAGAPDKDYCQKDFPYPTISNGSVPTGPPADAEPSPTDGSRALNCKACFNTSFTPMVENCGVCNTGRAVDDGKVREEVELVMMILTTHRAVDKRNAIRDTWASASKNNTGGVRHVFLLGRSKSDEDTELVKKEQEKHGDLLMYDFMDSYSNLTLKTITAMRWAERYCGQAKYILKVDDDMWINVPGLLKTCHAKDKELQTSVAGSCPRNASPIRNKHSKWYVSEKSYPQKTFPGYCSGTAYVTSLNVARHVVAVSPDVPFFHLEDVYVSLCIKRLGKPFQLMSTKGFFAWGSPCKQKGDDVISTHEVGPQKLREIWKASCRR